MSKRRPSKADAALQEARALWQRGESSRNCERYVERAFAKVAQASEIGHASIRLPESSGQLRPGRQITAVSPARLDLAGGWSDTPPYCYERGGHVVNVAIDLDGRPPVRAIVRTLSEPKLIIESPDLGMRIDLSDSPRGGPPTINDPFALHKVALGMTGILQEEKQPLSKRLKTLGGGLHIMTECRVPKGSGLGTSSILAATLLVALHAVRGRKISTSHLIQETLLLEQRLSSGGGWQDQIGGIIGGVKSTITGPGIPQRPKVEQLDLSDAQLQGLENRLVVYFSGQQRLARNILRRVMGRWLACEPEMVMLEELLKAGAAAMRRALLKGKWPNVAAEISQYWNIKKQMYAGSTTPAIDALLTKHRKDFAAAALAGAGGGGFGYFLCHSAAQAKRLRDQLAESSSRPGSLGSVYATNINRHGLVVTSSKS